MLHNTKQFRMGFTLVELLVATAILGGISVASIQLLYDVVTTRSKQNSIENTSSNVRFFIDSLSRSITLAKSISVRNANEIRITGSPCYAYRYNVSSKSIDRAFNSALNCDASNFTNSDFTSISWDNTSISNFTLSPIGNFPTVVNLTIAGAYKDNLSDHPFIYQTAITPRITL